MEGKEFKVNEFLSLELRGGKTFIYVNGKRFRQCKYVLLHIPIDDIEKYSKIKSIDEIINKLDHSLEELPETIPPETEFWAHCSNLQAWAEYDYNTDLLDSTLSFPLLKKLTQEGDPQAKKVFKEEIAKRLMRGEIQTVGYLIDEGYLNFLTYEEIISIFSSEDCCLLEHIFSAYLKDDTDQFHEANSLYNKIGKFLFIPIEKKVKQILELEDLVHLNIFLNYHMLDVLSDEEIISLFDPPTNFLEKALQILNKINYEETNIVYIGLISERVEKALGNKIREKLLNCIRKGNINYDLLLGLNLMKYMKNMDC
ncbi:MAG: hypothetical protein ACFFB0_01330 [Promethearchaeota archaeon]